ncbi:aminoglycoside N(3)-acetyltransferase [Halosegnis sp.]|uniref:aminoglycoside N(3)-acetyltransferase n=1 Tax=Halosegnis sp. TaxID=2864959 RepID=UPI0035D4BECA
MTDDRPVDRVDEPVTPARIAADLADLGVNPGETLLVHSSLSALGWVPGGPQGAVEGLRMAVGGKGTLVVPTHSTDLTDPSDWENPPIPESWYETVRAETPPYRPDATPTRGMGAIPECLRDYDEAVRSAHPHYSFAALGAAAEPIVAGHNFAAALGEGSPLAAVYERDGAVLMLGCDLGRNTSLHLAEHRADISHAYEPNGAPVLVDGEREYVTYDLLDMDDSDFADCSRAFAETHPESVTTGTVGAADATLFDQPALVDFATEWLAQARR